MAARLQFPKPTSKGLSTDLHSSPKMFCSYVKSSSTPRDKNPTEHEESSEWKRQSGRIDRVSSKSKTGQHCVKLKLELMKTDYNVLYTCNICDTTAINQLSIESYEKGVVVAVCDCCGNIGLIADRLGLFSESSSIEEFLASRGLKVKKGAIYSFCLTA